MKKIGIILGLFLSFTAHAQSDTLRILPKNSVYFEFLGNGGLYSINYERMFWQKNTWRIAGRVGVSGFPTAKLGSSITNWSMTLPLELLFLKGKRNHFFEAGVGVTPVVSWLRSTEQDYQNNFGGIGMVRLGYRYHSEKNFIFRAGILGGFGLEQRNNGSMPVIPWLGFSFGKSF